MSAGWAPEAPGATAVPGVQRADPFALGPVALRTVSALLVDLEAPSDVATASCPRIQEWAVTRAACLSRAERERANRFVTAETARRWVATRVVLRHLLGDRLQRAPDAVRFALGPHGKPSLADDAGVAFSLSHAGPFVLLAVGSGIELGADVESAMDERAAAEIAAALHPEERASVRLAPARSRRTATARAWVRKEAYLKALGTGLLRDPSLDLVGAEDEPLVPTAAPVGTVIADLPDPPGQAAYAALCAIC